MKSGLRILSLFALISSAFSLSAQYNYELKTSEDMMLLFDQQPNQLHKTVIVFEEQLDIKRYEQMFKRLRTSSDDRKVIVGTELQSIASRSQAQMLPKIKSITGLADSQILSYWVFNGLELYLNSDQAKAIAELPEVMAIEHIPVMEKYDSEVAAASAPAPNGHENAHDVIKATELWAMGYSGYGITSYTIDTGVNPKHPSLSANFKGNIEGNEEDAWYEASQGETPFDCDTDFHGTHVTGTILGLDRLTNDTIGAAFNANWIGAATVECPSGSSMSAMQYALDPDGNTSTADAPDVINNSWGQGPGTCNSISWQFVLNNIFAAGIANIWAAGNYGSGSETVGSPAQFIYNELNSFSVGNLNGYSQNYDITSSSSRGPSICSGSTSLKIKPEVSAPGYNVRSAVGDGGYAEYVGTSMAAPQVAGGVCLLKEAFPLVSGVDITEAIYLTAIDLGDAGEDNTYGNGLIDLMAAYNYLVDQGNIPSDPAYNHDILVHNLRANELNCASGVSTSFYVQNTSEESVTSFEYTVEFNGVTITESWEGNLGEGQNVLIEPSILYPDAGEGYLRVSVNLTSASDDRNLNNSMVKFIEVEETDLVTFENLTEDASCQGANQSALIVSSLNTSFDVFWYSDFEGINQYGTGNPLNVELEESTTLYAQPLYSTYVGSDKVENVESLESSSGRGLFFNAFQDFTLKSVEVNVLGPGFFNLALEDATGAVIQQRLTAVSVGVQRVDLNFNIPKGNGYRLKWNAQTKLGVQESDVSFPYLIDGVVNIYKSLAPTLPDQLNKYHYFFNWDICFFSECPPFPVPFEFNGTDGPSVSFEASAYDLDLQSGGQVDFTQDVSAGANFEWDFGNGQTSTEENPSITYSEAGTYVVTLKAEEGGCTSVYSKSIEVKNTMTNTSSVSNDLDILVYPNPVQNGRLYIESGDLEMNQLRLFNMSGMLLFDKQVDGLNNYIIEQNNNPPGVYFLQINTNRGLIVKKITF